MRDREMERGFTLTGAVKRQRGKTTVNEGPRPNMKFFFTGIQPSRTTATGGKNTLRGRASHPTIFEPL